jgi:hypothetical protein
VAQNGSAADDKDGDADLGDGPSVRDRTWLKERLARLHHATQRLVMGKFFTTMLGRWRISDVARARPLRPIALFLMIAGLMAPSALADNAVIPNDPSLPWTDAAHQSPLENVLSQIASRIAGRTVRARCEGETDWAALVPLADPGVASGFVDPRGLHYYPATRTLADSAQLEQFSPRACWYLWQFAMATTKPTKCPTTVDQTQTRYRTVRYPVKVKVRVHGKVRIKTVWRTRQEPYWVTVQVPGPLQPCDQVVGSDLTTYKLYARALQTVAHESIHLFDLTAGHSIDVPFEIRAECLGMQFLSSVATQLGDSPDDAAHLAQYYWQNLYPLEQGIIFNGFAYWSPDCVSGGAFDLTPTDGIWP